MESQEIMSSNKSQDVKIFPFICGICFLKFDEFGLFIQHFRSHSVTFPPDNGMHVCNCLFQSAENEGENNINETFKCRSCMKKFSSICHIHRHIVNCSKSNGSYVLDNSRKMVYPLSLHCADFDSRDHDNCDIADADHVKIEDENIEKCKDVHECQTAGLVNRNENNLKLADKDLHMDVLSKNKKTIAEKNYSQQVDHIFKCFSKLFENGEDAEISSVQGIDTAGTNRDKNKGRPRNQVKSHHLSDKTRTEIVNKRKNRNFAKDTKVIVEEDSANAVNELETDSDHIIVKTEDEETIVFDAKIDKNTELTQIMDNTEAKKEDDNNTFNDDNVDDLTDEYTLDILENKNKRLRKMTKNICRKKRGNSEKAAKECPHCGKFLKPYKLKVHLISHMEDRPFQCDMCPKSYKYQGHLDSHKASHQDVKPFYCEICGKGYVTLTVLKHHFMMHHSDSKPCVCNVCGASFITNYKLKRHMTKHTGEKSVQCDLCGMGFSTKYNLNIHIQGVHKKDHRFTCTECGKNFMTNYQLKVHNMKHSGERPYKCAVCKAEYIERKELRRHLKKNHNLPLEENTNALTELMEEYDASKIVTTKDEPQVSQFNDQSQGQVMEQTEVTSTALYISAGNENLYSYTTTDMCTSAPYYSGIKKLLPQNEYQMIYGNSQEYSYDNSSGGLTLPLTIQEMH